MDQRPDLGEVLPLGFLARAPDNDRSEREAVVIAEVPVGRRIEVDDFKKTTGDILRQLRESQKVPGAERIYTCGEKEHLAGIEREGKGVPVNAALQEQMITMRNELNLTKYHFPFD